MKMVLDLGWGYVLINPLEVENTGTWKGVPYTWPAEHHSSGSATSKVLRTLCQLTGGPNRLAAAAQHWREGHSAHISLAQEKVKTQKSKDVFYWTHINFTSLESQKKWKLTIVKSGEMS